MVKRRVRSLDEVDAKFRDDYEKRGDWFHLKLDADDGDGDGEDDDEPDEKRESADKRKVKEFRKENIRIRREMDELKAKFEGMDPEQYRVAMQALEAARNDEERELLRQGKFDEVLDVRHAKLKGIYEDALKKERDQRAAAEQAAAALKKTLHGDRVRSKLRAIADDMKVQLQPGASEDFFARALGVFTELDEDGELVAVDGEDLRLNADNQPYGPKDFVAEIVEKAPHLIVGASGAEIGGRTGGKKGAVRAGVLDIDPND